LEENTMARMAMRRAPGLVALPIIVAALGARAEDKVELLDGTMIRGKVTAQSAESVSIRTRYGMSLTLRAARIHKVQTSTGTEVYNEKPGAAARKGPAREAPSPARAPNAEPLSGELKIGDLVLEPVVLSLRSGKKVPGYHAFDTADRHIVYSPRLATLRSFPKRDVSSSSKSSREAVASMRTGFWPDEPPETGLKPAYTTEKWGPPERLMVWAKPGKSGRFEDPKNWYENGKPMEEWPVPTGSFYGLIFFRSGTTDLLFPSADKEYSVGMKGNNARTRHITVEDNARAGVSLNECIGNIWIGDKAQFNGGGGALLAGSRHTFFVNCDRYKDAPPKTPREFARFMKTGKSFARKWTVRKEDPKASIELIGAFGSGDETHWTRGVTILSENSTISIGGRCVQTVGSRAKLVMKSGSVLGKNGNQLYKNDMLVRGELSAGTPEEPITRDCFLGISIKDPNAKYSKFASDPKNRDRRYKGRYSLRGGGSLGLTVAPGGKISVHSAEPGKDKLVITWHGITDCGSDDGTSPGYYDKLPESERTINLVLLDDIQLNDVKLDWLGDGDILALDPEIRRTWKRVSFGGHNKGSGDGLYAKFPVNENSRKQMAKWREEVEQGRPEADRFTVASSSDAKGASYLRMVPSGGTYARGSSVTVTMHAFGDRGIRYVAGNGLQKSSPLYSEPIRLTETTTLSCGSEEVGIGGRLKWQVITDTFTFVAASRAPDRPGRTSPGLEVKVYKDNPIRPKSGSLGEAKRTATVERFELNVAKDEERKAGGYVYAGYFDVKKPGVYRFYTETQGASVLYIGDAAVVNNHRRYRYDWKPAARSPLESWGSLRLEAGKHAIRVAYARGHGFAWWDTKEVEPFVVSYEGPGIEKQPIPASVLSH
jgi:hypothetical protein